ncbi:MAG: PG0870-related protein, partial [Bacteroidales bacterium]|nr:PG0870-related protein [Bacteroidales bacterium]
MKTMKTFRYQLKRYLRGNKVTCPQCGKPRCFTLYVDTLTGKDCPPQYGICDHRNSCGYHKYPTDSAPNPP